MGALTWDEARSGYAVPAPTAPTGPRRAPARPERPRLVLVPTGDAVVDAGVRVSRRGRLLVTGVVMLVVLAAGSLALSRAFAAPAAAAQPTTTVTVQAGQTLSEIAERYVSGMSLDSAVATIQIANNLDSTQISAGQRLVVPQT